MYVCVYVCMCMYVYMYVCVCMYVRTYVCIYVCMYVCAVFRHSIFSRTAKCPGSYPWVYAYPRLGITALDEARLNEMNAAWHVRDVWLADAPAPISSANESTILGE